MPPPAVQPLVVTETREPDPTFALPQTTLTLPERRTLALQVPQTLPTPREVAIIERDAAVRALPLPLAPSQVRLDAPPAPQAREVQLLERPVLNTPSLPLPQARTVPLPQAPAPTVGREIVLAPPPVQPAALPVPSAAPRALPDTPVTGQAGEIPLRQPPVTAARGDGGDRVSPPAPTGRAQGTGTTSQGAARTPAPAPTGRPGGTANAGAGPRPAAPPGGLQAPVRGDDWGVSQRDRPGSATGREAAPGAGGSSLFNADGSVRLPGDGGRVGGGLPPGAIIEDFEKIDRMGTWLKRPPVDYTPSRFDALYVPHESLLQEWVRKNVREVYVPIPGTSKKVRCVVSLLQASGACTIDDPNLQDQEAEARPPPAIPYKPELQETP